MIGIVLDTNVVVSAHLNEGGAESLLFQFALNGVLRLFVSKPILAEYEEVLRKEFGLDPEKIEHSLEGSRNRQPISQNLFLTLCELKVMGTTRRFALWKT